MMYAFLIPHPPTILTTVSNHDFVTVTIGKVFQNGK
jgi:hypothetical protein